jgi:hypothetical protein
MTQMIADGAQNVQNAQQTALNRQSMLPATAGVADVGAYTGPRSTGKATSANGSKWGNPNDPNFSKNNIVTIKYGNQQWQVNKAAAAAYTGFLNELGATGYKISSSGGYVNRDIRGKPGQKSNHAYGVAIDINAAANPMLNGRLQTNLPKNIGEIASKYNLAWGGNWKNRPDPMHFEYLG